MQLKEAEAKLDETVSTLTESYEERIKTMEEDRQRTEVSWLSSQREREFSLVDLVDFSLNRDYYCCMISLTHTFVLVFVTNIFISSSSCFCCFSK
jgi:hypothetical protein